jgi:hypothetical protein
VPHAFDTCRNLASVTIGNSVTSIGDYAFNSLVNLATVRFGNSVTSIGDHAFAFCASLTNVTLPSSVTSIATHAFYYCSKLTSITIPNSVTNIWDYAFNGCTNLTAVYFQGNAPPLTNDWSVFQNDPATVYYLPGTTGWAPTYDLLPTVLWNPQVQTSDPSFGIRTNRFGFIITGTPNISLAVEASTGLANPVWVPLQTFTLTSGSVYFSDPAWTNYPTRFYRLRFP